MSDQIMDSDALLQGFALDSTTTVELPGTDRTVVVGPMSAGQLVGCSDHEGAASVAYCVACGLRQPDGEPMFGPAILADDLDTIQRSLSGPQLRAIFEAVERLSGLREMGETITGDELPE